MLHSNASEINIHVEEEDSGVQYLYVESIYLSGEPELSAVLAGAGSTGSEQGFLPERGLPPNPSRAVQLAAAADHPRHPTWLYPAELAEVEARYYAWTGKHEPHLQQLLARMESRGSSNWRAVVWLA